MSHGDCFFKVVLFLFLATLLKETNADNILIDCGSLVNTTLGNRVFLADRYASKYLSSSQNLFGNTSPSTNLPIYQTARIFNGTATYTLPISQTGRYFIRLYFFPFVFGAYNLSDSSFTVSAQQFVLLSGFTPQQSATMKEYSVNVASKNLVVTFSPAPNSVAFLNAVEVVLVPDMLIQNDAKLIDQPEIFQGLTTLALGTVARVNMGGPTVNYNNDTLWRTWVPDDGYLQNKDFSVVLQKIAAVRYAQSGLASRDDAPASVYGTCRKMNSQGNPSANFNVTWDFTVDLGFQYLIRLHFCDIVSPALDQLYFNVFVDSLIMLRSYDISAASGSVLGTPIYVDFVTPTASSNKLRLSIGPADVNGNYPDAILNGLEIMKLSNSKNTLDGAAAVVPSSKTKRKTEVGVIMGVIFGGVSLVVLGVILFFFCRRHRKKQARRNSKTWNSLSLTGGTFHTTGSKYSNGTITDKASNLGYRVPLSAVQEATNSFDESRVIGIGGFGKVYKGKLSDGTEVAVKRGNPQSQQGLNEFQTEIEMLSQFRHRHLVSLIGYCDENNEMILIYEYMENGTLKSHLYGSGYPSLTWKQRLEICIGSARGLHYLHTAHAKPVIHRDVKSANILLDENFMAKVADFGLSKTGPELDQTHVSTAVKGSFGYLDPEYFRRQQLTEKSDVYSFGVVLFEVLCARPVIDPTRTREMVNLAEWAMNWQKKGQIEHIVDPNLEGTIKPQSLRKFGETAEKCLADYGVDRPSMGDLLWNLEYALQLQETTIPDDEDEEHSMIGDINIASHVSNFKDASVSSMQFNDESANSIGDLSGVSMSKVFSQLVKSEAR